MADTEPRDNQQRKPISDGMLVRRRLLKLGAYVPPAIMGMMILGRGVASADGSSDGSGDHRHHSSASCGPKACSPCRENSESRDCRRHKREGNKRKTRDS